MCNCISYPYLRSPLLLFFFSHMQTLSRSGKSMGGREKEEAEKDFPLLCSLRRGHRSDGGPRRTEGRQKGEENRRDGVTSRGPDEDEDEEVGLRSEGDSASSTLLLNRTTFFLYFWKREKTRREDALSYPEKYSWPFSFPFRAPSPLPFFPPPLSIYAHLVPRPTFLHLTHTQTHNS